MKQACEVIHEGLERLRNAAPRAIPREVRMSTATLEAFMVEVRKGTILTGESDSPVSKLFGLMLVKDGSIAEGWAEIHASDGTHLRSVHIRVAR